MRDVGLPGPHFVRPRPPRDFCSNGTAAVIRARLTPATRKSKLTAWFFASCDLRIATLLPPVIDRGLIGFP